MIIEIGLDLFACLKILAEKEYDQRVKTDLNTYGSLLQSKARAGSAGQGSAALKKGAGGAAPLDLKTVKPVGPDYKLDLSDGVKPQAPAAASSSTSGSLPSAPSLPSTPSIPDLPKDLPKADAKPKLEIPEEAKKIKDAEKVKDLKEVTKDKKAGTEKRPLIVFIKGLDMFSSPSKSERGYAGVGKMADAVEGSRIYGWDQHDEIIEEVNKIHKDYPVILVGHSLGGDTAVEVADKLDSLEQGFRKVDLLVTIDSVGFDNDIIPQNVKKHLNFFGEHDFFLNDDPHVARNHELTDVKNILSPYDHTELDDDKSIQFEIVTQITEAMHKRA